MFLEIIRVSILQLILALKKMDGFLKVRLASFNTCQSLRGHCLIKSFEIFQHRAKELLLPGDFGFFLASDSHETISYEKWIRECGLPAGLSPSCDSVSVPSWMTLVEAEHRAWAQLTMLTHFVESIQVPDINRLLGYPLNLHRPQSPQKGFAMEENRLVGGWTRTDIHSSTWCAIDSQVLVEVLLHLWKSERNRV